MTVGEAPAKLKSLSLTPFLHTDPHNISPLGPCLALLTPSPFPKNVPPLLAPVVVVVVGVTTGVTGVVVVVAGACLCMCV